MTKWIGPHLPVIATIVAIVALLGSITTIVAVITIARRFTRMISDRTKPDSGATDVLRELSERIAAVDTALRELQSRYADQKLTTDQYETRTSKVFEKLAHARQHSLAARLRDNSYLEQLGTIYKEAIQRMEPTVYALAAIRDCVKLLLTVVPVDSSQYQYVRSVADQFRGLATAVSELEKAPKTIAAAMDIEARMSALSEGYNSGTLSPDSYLSALLNITIPNEMVFADPDAECRRLQALPEATHSGLLDFVDSVTELRDRLHDAAEIAGSRECDRVIKACAELFEKCGVRLVDVARGTIFDARLHDLYAAIPRPDTTPETIIGVRRLGQRRGGELIRKPQVVVAAGGI